MTPRRLPRPPGRPTAVLALTVVVLLALLLASATAGAQAGAVRIDRLTATPTQAAADGGRISISVALSDISPAGETITLATTHGAFGGAAGPTRIVLPVTPGRDGAAVATVVLVGNGSVGRATVTAFSFISSRRITVRFIGAPVRLSFVAPPAGDLAVGEPQAVDLRAYDTAGAPVPGAQVALSTDHGRLHAAGAEGAAITLTTDAQGRVRAQLEGPPGAVLLQARARAAIATRVLRLVGPPASLELRGGGGVMHLQDDPPTAPLVALVRDHAGQPLPGVPLRFTVDAPGVRVVTAAPGGSFETDADGTLRARLAAGEGAAPGMATVTVRVGALASSVQVRVAGPPATVLLSMTDLGGGRFYLRAVLRDAAGLPVVSAAEVSWRAPGAPPAATARFTPPVSAVSAGEAETVVTVVADPPVSLAVQAVVVGSDPLVGAAVVLPHPLPTEGTALEAGLNTLIWTGPHNYISSVVAPIARVVVTAWRYDLGAGWQAYSPNTDDPQDYLIAQGNRFWIRVTQPVLLPDVELAGP